MLLDRIADGSQDRYVVIRDNRPMAVLLSTARYESLIAELDDLRIDAAALSRLSLLKQSVPIAHADMMRKFENEN